MILFLVLYSGGEITLVIFFGYLIYIGIKNQLRLTIRIEITIAFFIYIASQTDIFYSFSGEKYCFLIYVQNFSFAILIIITIAIRSNFQKIPNPPIYNITSEYVYECKLLYIHMHDFLNTLATKDLLNALELGFYIQLYELQKKKSTLKIINNLCIKCNLPLFSSDCEEFIYEYVSSNNEMSFQFFCMTSFYQKLK